MTTTDTDIATARNITKTRNRQAIIRHLAMHGNVTKRQLQLDLQLSLPTITGNIRALEHDGIIAPGPLTDSTGGRKSQSYRFNPSHRTAIGVTMHRNTLRLCAIDLQGRPIATLSRTLPYANTNAYYQRMGSAINDFAAETEKAHGPFSAYPSPSPVPSRPTAPSSPSTTRPERPASPSTPSPSRCATRVN